MNLPIAPMIAGVLGGAVALGALIVPMPALEGLVMGSGLPAVIAAAEPPLGFTARFIMAFGAGASTALFSWFALFVLLGSRTVTIGDGEEIDPDAVLTPVLRRADAHPDAPPRPPLLATRDLGRPFDAFRTPADIVKIHVEEMDMVEEIAAPVTEPAVAPVEQPLPVDLDQPLAAFDPDAMPEVPLAAPVALPPLSRSSKPPVFDETERFEVFELPTPVRPEPRPISLVSREDAITRPETEASVHALLERLERGVLRRSLTPAPAPSPRVERRARERGLEDALVTLRNMARRA
ncbi:hypothetical protein [Sphingomonas sp. Root241]|uniref:hypothetical protein n=1 Tax=Sphingomonas sp. Root241 TaxID=1736501 RepID=UPI0006FC50A7|nr:hypothetical protein [Sphingomonas sp. Root241]KRC78949.1 hypothetical protein ASE13_16020 [Sphingomonas sp. Root241]